MNDDEKTLEEYGFKGALEGEPEVTSWRHGALSVIQRSLDASTLPLCASRQRPGPPYSPPCSPPSLP